MTEKALIPPDRTRCQAMIPGNGPFTMGGFIGDPRDGYRVRCENKPVAVITERKPGPDGLCGSMSVCDRCKTKFIEYYGKDYATFKTIRVRKKEA